MEVLCWETPDFVSLDLWPPNSPDLNPVDYEICDVMQRRVYQRKSTPSTNWSRVWLKFGASLNSRLSTWLLLSGAKDLELVFVRSLWAYWVSWFCQLFVTFFFMFCLNFASLSKTVWVTGGWTVRVRTTWLVTWVVNGICRICRRHHWSNASSRFPDFTVTSHISEPYSRTSRT